MKLYNFKSADGYDYCITKLDRYNFSIREYLPKQVNRTMKDGRIFTQEFYQPIDFFGSLEYTLRKAFRHLDKDWIEQDEFMANLPDSTVKESMYRLKPRQVNSDNVENVKSFIKEVISYGK